MFLIRCAAALQRRPRPYSRCHLPCELPAPVPRRRRENHACERGEKVELLHARASASLNPSRVRFALFFFMAALPRKLLFIGALSASLQRGVCCAGPWCGVRRGLSVAVTCRSPLRPQLRLRGGRGDQSQDLQLSGFERCVVYEFVMMNMRNKNAAHNIAENFGVNYIEKL